MAATDVNILSDIKTKFNICDSALQDKRVKWKEYFKYFISSKTTTYNVYRQSRLLPYAFSTVMSILPRIVNQRPRVRYIMRNMPEYFEDAIEGMKLYGGQDLDVDKLRYDAINALDYTIKYQWNRQKFDTAMNEIILNSLIYGTGIGMVYWDTEHNAPKLKSIEPFYFIPEAGVSSIDDMNYCFTVSYLPKDTVARLFKQKIYKSKYKKQVLEQATYYNNDADKNDRFFFMRETRQTVEMIKVIEYYSRDSIITYIDDFVVRKEKNSLDMLPFVAVPNYVITGDFWGLSEIDQIEQFIKDMTDFRNNRHVNIELMSNTMWRVDPNKEVNIDDLVSAPGQIIEAEEGALEPLRVPPISDNTYKEDAVMMNDIRETSGISDYMRGGTPDRFETATTVDSLVRSGNMRITIRTTNLVNYFIKPLGDLLIKYNKLYLKPMNIIVKTDNGFETKYISVDFIKTIRDGDFDLLTIPKDIDNLKRTEFMQVLQIALQSPQMAQMFDLKQLFKELFKTYNISTAGIFKSDAQIQQEQQLQQQQMLMQQMQGRGQVVQNNLGGMNGNR